MLNPVLTSKFEDEILNLIEKRDQFTQSDLQSVVSVLVNKIMHEGYEILSNQNSDTI